MKPIVSQENALNLLFEKNESEVLKELALINSQKEICLSKIAKLQDKLKNNPSPIQVNQKFDVFKLSNYSNYSQSIETAIHDLEMELKLINEKLLPIQQRLAQINYKQDIFANYFSKLKQDESRLKDKKAEGIIQDQYTHVKKFLRIHQK